MTKNNPNNNVVLYKKEGDEFVPIGLSDLVIPYDFGDYLVRVRPGRKNLQRKAIPLKINHAKMEIMIAEAIDAIALALVRASEKHPQKHILTPREKRAWNAFKKIARDDIFALQIDSAYEIAHQAVRCLRENLEGESKCPDNCLEVFAEKKNKKKNKKERYARNSKMV